MPLQNVHKHELQRDHVEHAYRLAAYIARTLPNLDEDDALTAAMDGLARAAEKFDPLRNGDFWDYARHRIRWSIMDYVRSHLGVRVSLDEWDEPIAWSDMDGYVFARMLVRRVSVVDAMIVIATEVYGRPIKEVAAACQVTKSRISQRRHSAMLALRQAAGANDNR